MTENTFVDQCFSNGEGISPEVGKPRLLDRVRAVIRCKHYSIRTEHSYIDWIRRYIYFHNKQHPEDMGEQHISAFLTHPGC